MHYHHTRQKLDVTAVRQTVRPWTSTTETKFQSVAEFTSTVGTEEHPAVAGGLPPFLYLPYENFRTNLKQSLIVSCRANIYDSYPSLAHDRRRYSYVYAGELPQLWYPDAVLPERLPEGSLINACYQALADNKVNLGVLVAELNQTVTLLGKTASRISSAAFAVRKGKFAKAARILRTKIPKGVSKSKHWSDNFLAYQYGWLPLIADACGAAEHLALRGYKFPLLTVRARTPKETKVVQNAAVTGWATATNLSLTYQYSSKIEECHEVVMKFNVTDDFWREVAQLGLTNPFSLKWETIPFSFVADWFSSVGVVLQSISAAHGLRFRTGGYMRMQKVVTTYNFRDVSFTLDRYQKVESKDYTQIQEGVMTSVAQRRETYSEMPPPELFFRIPTGNNLNRAITAVALGRQRLG
jgi:hypothetical protein